MKNIWDVISNTRKILKTRDDIDAHEIVEIVKKSKTYFEIVGNAYTLGYARGVKKQNNK